MRRIGSPKGPYSPHWSAAARREIALRLAVLRAAQDPAVVAAAADFDERVAENRPYENARPAEDVIREAHARDGAP